MTNPIFIFPKLRFLNYCPLIGYTKLSAFVPIHRQQNHIQYIFYTISYFIPPMFSLIFRAKCHHIGKNNDAPMYDVLRLKHHIRRPLILKYKKFCHSKNLEIEILSRLSWQISGIQNTTIFVYPPYWVFIFCPTLRYFSQSNYTNTVYNFTMMPTKLIFTTTYFSFDLLSFWCHHILIIIKIIKIMPQTNSSHMIKTYRL